MSLMRESKINISVKVNNDRSRLLNKIHSKLSSRVIKSRWWSMIMMGFHWRKRKWSIEWWSFLYSDQINSQSYLLLNIITKIQLNGILLIHSIRSNKKDYLHYSFKYWRAIILLWDRAILDSNHKCIYFSNISNKQWDLDPQ